MLACILTHIYHPQVVGPSNRAHNFTCPITTPLHAVHHHNTIACGASEHQRKCSHALDHRVVLYKHSACYCLLLLYDPNSITEVACAHVTCSACTAQLTVVPLLAGSLGHKLPSSPACFPPLAPWPAGAAIGITKDTFNIKAIKQAILIKAPSCAACMWKAGWMSSPVILYDYFNLGCLSHLNTCRRCFPTILGASNHSVGCGCLYIHTHTSIWMFSRSSVVQLSQ